MAQKRKQLSFVPEFKGKIEGYVVNYLKKNYWRVAAHHEYEDLLQEAYFKFLVVKDKYPEVVNPPHFMALFKTAWNNHFINLSKTQTKDITIIESQLMGEISLFELSDKKGRVNDHEGDVTILLKQAPEEIQLLFAALDDTDLVKLLRQKSQKIRNGNRRARRETTNQALCRILGLNPEDVDIRNMLFNHFL